MRKYAVLFVALLALATAASAAEYSLDEVRDIINEARQGNTQCGIWDVGIVKRYLEEGFVPGDAYDKSAARLYSLEKCYGHLTTEEARTLRDSRYDKEVPGTATYRETSRMERVAPREPTYSADTPIGGFANRTALMNYVWDVIRNKDPRCRIWATGGNSPGGSMVEKYAISGFEPKGYSGTVRHYSLPVCFPQIQSGSGEMRDYYGTTDATGREVRRAEVLGRTRALREERLEERAGLSIRPQTELEPIVFSDWTLTRLKDYYEQVVAGLHPASRYISGLCRLFTFPEVHGFAQSGELPWALDQQHNVYGGRGALFSKCFRTLVEAVKNSKTGKAEIVVRRTTPEGVAKTQELVKSEDLETVRTTPAEMGEYSAECRASTKPLDREFSCKLRPGQGDKRVIEVCCSQYLNR